MGIILYYSCARQWKKTFRRNTSFQENLFFFHFFRCLKQSFSQKNTNGTKIKKFKDTCIVFVWVKRNSGLLCCETNIWKKIFMCVTNSKQKFHMWNKNENILGHFVYFMCENNRIILYIYLKKKNVNCLSLGFTTNYFLGANKFSCEANFFSMHEKSWHSHCFTLKKNLCITVQKNPH